MLSVSKVSACPAAANLNRRARSPAGGVNNAESNRLDRSPESRSFNGLDLSMTKKITAKATRPNYIASVPSSAYAGNSTMKKVGLGLAIALFLSVSCRADPIFILPDAWAKNHGGFAAFVNACRSKGVFSEYEDRSYTSALAKLISISTYNRAIFEHEFRDQERKIPGAPEGHMTKACNDMKWGMPSAIAALQSTYDEGVQWLSSARDEEQREIARQRQIQMNQFMSDFADSMASFSRNMQRFGQNTMIYSQQQMYQNSPQPTFGIPSSQARSYLINTSAGQRQCIVNRSGYVFCP